MTSADNTYDNPNPRTTDTKITFKKKKQRTISVYLRRNMLPANLITESLSELGYWVQLNEASSRLPSETQIKYDLVWGAPSDDNSVPAKFKNRIPGIENPCRKATLCEVINIMHDLFPQDFSFHPQSWSIPHQYKEFCLQYDLIKKKLKKKEQYFILKPDEGSQGEGIYLFKSPNELSQRILTKNSVVQRYIHNPLLIDNLKFDFRLYVLVSKLDPLEVYLCKEGLTRFCTQKYEKPSENNSFKTYMHLTNYSLNKYSKEFDKSEEESVGSKRTASSVFSALQCLGYDIATLWCSIEDLVLKTLMCIAPVANAEQSNIQDQNVQHFQLLGFDILIDEDLNPFLLEINGFPSMQTDCETYDHLSKITKCPSPVDEKVKKIVMKGALHILFKKVPDDSYIPIITPNVPEKKRHYSILDHCSRLFTMFLSKGKGSLIGMSGFRAFVRSSKLINLIPGVNTAELDLLYIKIVCEQSDDISSKSLSFLAFYRLILLLATRKYPKETLYEAVLFFVDACFSNISKNDCNITHH